ncbi:MAG: hypothetical protein IJX92_03720 [Clostridia bacterium]|nr:hypothetical protein [Clostridia bacterium]
MAASYNKNENTYSKKKTPFIKAKSAARLLTVFMILSTFLFTTVHGLYVYAQSGELIDTAEDQPLPSQYCMRDEYIVYAQDQDKHGYCWNFAATMAASTTIMKATNEYYDFSELWTGVALNACTNKHNKKFLSAKRHSPKTAGRKKLYQKIKKAK